MAADDPTCPVADKLESNDTVKPYHDRDRFLKSLKNLNESSRTQGIKQHVGRLRYMRLKYAYSMI
jgi:hypothetical protein